MHRGDQQEAIASGGADVTGEASECWTLVDDGDCASERSFDGSQSAEQQCASPALTEVTDGCASPQIELATDLEQSPPLSPEASLVEGSAQAAQDGDGQLEAEDPEVVVSEPVVEGQAVQSAELSSSGAAESLPSPQLVLKGGLVDTESDEIAGPAQVEEVQDAHSAAAQLLPSGTSGAAAAPSEREVDEDMPALQAGAEQPPSDAVSAIPGGQPPPAGAEQHAAFAERQQAQRRVTAVASAAVSAWLSSAGDLVGCVVEEVRGECGELTALLKHVAGAAHSRVGDAKGVTLHHVQAARQRLAKALQGHCPSWALLSLGAVTALAFVALGTLMLVNHKLAAQLKQRDRELARLVLRIMSLQETLQSTHAAVPILRRAVIQPSFAISNMA